MDAYQRNVFLWFLKAEVDKQIVYPRERRERILRHIYPWPRGYDPVKEANQYLKRVVELEGRTS